MGADPRSAIDELVRRAHLKPVDRAELPARAPHFASIPTQLHPNVRELLSRKYPKGLYRHQAQAIELVINGKDVCMATPTASGKSLAFMSSAAHLALTREGARTLALYPARALIQDQIRKWQENLADLGLRVGFVDGSVPRKERARVLRESNILLMTPDVVQAWLMAECGAPAPRRFLGELSLLILDEAHVYDGVFGTNMAYLLRRLACVSSDYRVIASTATVGAPEAFIDQLAGRRSVVLDESSDGSAAPPRSIVLCEPAEDDEFEAASRLLLRLSEARLGPFLAFADSRRMVEVLVARANRGSESEVPEHVSEQDPARTRQEDEQSEPEGSHDGQILPYRAGYEAYDRRQIQRALEEGRLAGVVSTSALELGIDIGDIGVVVLLSLPRTVSSLWQRIGRMGRKHAGVCLILRSQDSTEDVKLSAILQRPLEPHRLYLANRYVQYVHALCAAREIAAVGDLAKREVFASLPDQFREMLDNELNPTRPVEPDLFVLKQRAAGGPHLEFPLRSAGEKSFRVFGPFDKGLGTLTFDQVLREAYPGAVYYYLGKPYRVYRVDLREGKVFCKRERFYTTSPVMISMVFPELRGGVLAGRKSGTSLICEAEVQVSERVVGFSEKRGAARISEVYGPTSTYSPNPLQRYFRTTGVCWTASDERVVSEVATTALFDAFVEECGVHERDIGLGTFRAREVPGMEGLVRGMCIYDSTSGSLRLTADFLGSFDSVVERAIRRLKSGRRSDIADALLEFRRTIVSGEILEDDQLGASTSAADEDVVVVVASGSKAMYLADSGPREVTVRGHVYTPHGLLYDLVPEQEGVRWRVPAQRISPLPGESVMVELDLHTMETRPLSSR